MLHIKNCAAYQTLLKTVGWIILQYWQLSKVNYFRKRLLLWNFTKFWIYFWNNRYKPLTGKVLKVQIDKEYRGAFRTLSHNYDRAFREISLRFSDVTYFRKKFNLRCLHGSEYTSGILFSPRPFCHCNIFLSVLILNNRSKTTYVCCHFKIFFFFSCRFHTLFYKTLPPWH